MPDGARGKVPLVIAGTASGSGKTTVATGLMGALQRRGLSVAPFKVGPDYIDPGFHAMASGTQSRNLDTWLASPQRVREIFNAAARVSDISVIEGVMGLFDGRAGVRAGSDEGSTAEVARLLGGVVVLVVDCSSMARSLAPLLAGFADFDPRLSIGGVVLNNAGSDNHGRLLRQAAAEAGVPVLGVLPRRGEMSLPSRHLGLVPVDETDEAMEQVMQITKHVEENLDIDGIISMTGTVVDASHPGKDGNLPDSGAVFARKDDKGTGPGRSARIAVARDRAFSFYYTSGLEELERAGAELQFFSPLADRVLPPCDGVYLGGGFPEIFARELEENTSMRASIRSAAASGMPVYAECGGMVYLCDNLKVDGSTFGMAGAIPASARMRQARQALGYVEAVALSDNLLLDRGESIRGHEFHWSTLDWPDDDEAYRIFPTRGGETSGGFAAGNLLASFVHVDFTGFEEAASRFVRACADSQKTSEQSAGCCEQEQGGMETDG